MKTKFAKVVSLYILALTIGVIAQSCCREPDHKICNIDLSIYSPTSALSALNQNDADEIDTSYDHFGFVITGNVIDVSEVCYRVSPFINSAYAFQPCLPPIVDSIPRSNINLSLDRDIIYDGTTVMAGTNLMNDPIIGDAINYEYYNYSEFSGTISMDSSSYSMLQLDTGYYRVSLSASSITGASTVRSREVLFEEY